MQVQSTKLAKILGKIIQQHRISLGKSVYKISAESSVPKTTWLRIEKGICENLYLSSLWKIAEGLEIPPEELIKELREKLGDDFSLIEE